MYSKQTWHPSFHCDVASCIIFTMLGVCTVPQLMYSSEPTGLETEQSRPITPVSVDNLCLRCHGIYMVGMQNIIVAASS